MTLDDKMSLWAGKTDSVIVLVKCIIIVYIINPQ